MSGFSRTQSIRRWLSAVRRKPNCGARAVTCTGRFDGDVPAHSFDKRSGERQPQASTAMLSCMTLVDLVKLFEKATLLIEGDADTSVGHGDANALGVLVIDGIDADAAFVRELNRVADEV